MPRQHAAHTSSSSTTATAAVSSITSAGSGGTRAVDANHWLLGFEEITVVRAIGEGSFGRVRLGEWEGRERRERGRGDRQRGGRDSSTLPFAESRPRSCQCLGRSRHKGCKFRDVGRGAKGASLLVCMLQLPQLCRCVVPRRPPPFGISA